MAHSRTKHIDVRYNYIREAINEEIIQLKYCPTENMVADILTKPLTKGRYEMLRDKMGLEKVKSATLDELSGSVEGNN